MSEIILTLAGQIVVLVTVLVGFRRSLEKSQELHVSLNSRLSELIAAVRGEADAAGHARGLAEGRVERRENEGG